MRVRIPKARVRVLEYFLAFFKIINICLFFYKYLQQLFGCHESIIDERFLRVIDHAKQK